METIESGEVLQGGVGFLMPGLSTSLLMYLQEMDTPSPGEIMLPYQETEVHCTFNQP